MKDTPTVSSSACILLVLYYRFNDLWGRSGARVRQQIISCGDKLRTRTCEKCKDQLTNVLITYQ